VVSANPCFKEQLVQHDALSQVLNVLNSSCQTQGSELQHIPRSISGQMALHGFAKELDAGQYAS